MDALDKKLLRDFRRLWAQALAIALVLACGVSILLMSFGMYRSLDDTREAYYDRNRFADVFASANRVPQSVLPRVAAIPGVRAAEARATGYVIIDIEGKMEAATGWLISLPQSGAPRLNLPLLRAGRLPDPDAANEVAVNAPFAAENGLRPGDTFQVNLNGQKRTLTLTGTVLSPEFIYTLGPGALMPDNANFGVLWMPHRAVAAAFDMQGAFNELSLQLAPGASEDEVIDRVDDLLAPYGGVGAHGRDAQISHSFLDSELQQLRVTAMVLPPIFFGISAFLVNMVIGRIVALERTEIGLLKALGYSNLQVCVHYLLLAGLIAVAGTLIGWATGAWLARGLAQLYAQFFDFPFLLFAVAYDIYAISGLLALVTAALGAAQSALRAARLAPAVAMAPPAPPRFRRTLLDRVLSLLRPSQSVMMILRSLMRWPVRSALTTLGLSLAVAVLVASSFFDDALDHIIDSFFTQANRQNAMLIFEPDIPEAALADVRNLPGVMHAEGQFFQAAVLRNGHLEKDTPIEARRPGNDLARILDSEGHVVEPMAGGLLLSERLAAQLEVAAGDAIEVEFLGGRKETHIIPVAGTVTQYIGLGAYMDLDELAALRREAPRISVANVALDEAALPALHAMLKDTPELAGLVQIDTMRRSFVDTIRQNVVVMTTIYVIVALLVTVGVTYNGARIQLSERARELASLRILGFSRREVSFILMGESMLLALLAQPLGWALGAGIAWTMASSSTSDLYAIPLVLEPDGFARASLIVLGAALASSLLVRRRLDDMDLVAVMKTRE